MQEQYEQHLKIREEYPIDKLAKVWDETEAAYQLAADGVTKIYALGTRGITKMIQFAAEVELKNIDIDYWMAIRPERIEGETREEFKLRSKFQKALLKYRPIIYKFSNVTAKKLKHARKQAKKQQQIIK